MAEQKFRYQEELAATIEEMRVLKKHGETFDIKKRAKILSGAPYLWCVDYKKAKRDLDKVWEKIIF